MPVYENIGDGDSFSQFSYWNLKKEGFQWKYQKKAFLET